MLLSVLLQKESIDHLAHFVYTLRLGLKAEVGQRALVIWYDSVTAEGKLDWQNELNGHNERWFEVADAIFLNYTWKASGMNLTANKN